MKKEPIKVISSEIVISMAKVLLGKLISQFTDREEDGGCKWLKEIILKICSGSPLNPKFEIKPINSDSVYVRNLYSNFQNGKVEICNVTLHCYIFLLMIFQREVHGGELRW